MQRKKRITEKSQITPTQENIKQKIVLSKKLHFAL